MSNDTSKAQAAYKQSRVEAQVAFNKAVAPAHAVYKEAQTDLNKTTAAARAAYYAAIATAKATYDKARSTTEE